MKLVIDYLLESAFILGLLVAFYHLFLRKEAMFWFNRAYLLLSISMAALVPVLHFSFRFSSRESEELMLLTLDTVNVYASQSKAGLIAGLLMVPQVDWLYGLGAFILLIRLLWGLVKVGGLFRIRTANVFQGVKVIDLPGRFAPFSFFNVIFMNQSGYSDKDLDQVLTHERAHVQLKHSLDVILVELFLIIQWFNPFAWLLP